MTRCVATVDELRRWLRRQRRARRTVGFVPTMGALHEGHLSLVRRSAAENDRTVVSIFVNPTQFGPHEDLDRYPRRLEADLDACRTAGADLVFAPTPDEVYPEGFQTTVTVEGVTKGLCGRSRPGHFRGVATVCSKLFGMVEPDRAYFGLKDYQQYVVIRRMVRDLNMNVEIVGCETVRERDGLAMSSRNAYLNEEERGEAPVLYRSLMRAKELVEVEGVTNVRKITRAMRGVIRTARHAQIDYLSVVHPDTLTPLRTITGDAVVALAVYVNRTRLIDNIRVRTKCSRSRIPVGLNGRSRKHAQGGGRGAASAPRRGDRPKTR